MANFLYSRWWDRADDVTSHILPVLTLGGGATEMAGYAKSNVFLGGPSQMSRFNEHTGWWQCQFGMGGQRIDVVGFINPLIDEGCHLRVQASNVSNYSVLGMDVTVDVPTAWPDSIYPTFKNVWVDLTTKAGYSTSGYQYWRFGSTDNAIALGLGELWLSSVKRSLPFVQKGGARRVQRSLVTHETELGTRLVYDRGVTRREFDVEVIAATESQLKDLQDWWMNSQGGLHPSLIIPDDTESECYMVAFSDRRLTWVRETPIVKRVTLPFVELSRGVVV